MHLWKFWCFQHTRWNILGIHLKKVNTLYVITTVNLSHAEYLYMYVVHSSPIFILFTSSIPDVSMHFLIRVTNSFDPDQVVSSEARWLGRVGHSVTCLATNASLTADPGVTSSIPAWWRLIIKSFLRSFSSLPLNHSRRIVVRYKRKYVHKVLVNCLFKLADEKSVVRWTDRLAITIAVDLGCKATKQTNKRSQLIWIYSAF